MYSNVNMTAASSARKKKKGKKKGKKKKKGKGDRTVVISSARKILDGSVVYQNDLSPIDEESEIVQT